MVERVPPTPVEALVRWASVKPDTVALTVLSDDGDPVATLRYGEIDRTARRIAAAVVAAGGQGKPVMIPAVHDATFVPALFGCWYAGAIATPVPPSVRPQGFGRLSSIIADAGVGLVVGNGSVAAAMTARFDGLALVEPGEASVGPVPTNRSAPALLQYTSGSTGSPRGVVVTHHNLAVNLAMAAIGFEADEDSRFLSWLPLYHDMGLIAQLVLSLYSGAQFFLMRPTGFVQKPARWLAAIGRYRATVSGAPNFAYEICTRRVPATADLDLSSWRAAFCGAEPVRYATMERFGETFASRGFDNAALFPCYGLAEATVYVSSVPVGSGVRIREGLVSCGPPAGPLAVVDPDTRRRVPDGETGELWVGGDHVAAGYWNAGEPGVFGAVIAGEESAPWLRTGDLGFLRDGELYVAGRLKNLIIHRGANLHPEDIEAAIAASDPGFGAIGAAFAVDANGEEQVAAVFEMARGADAGMAAIRHMIARAITTVADRHGVRLHDLALVPPGRLPRTTSGKVQRAACRARYVAGALPAIDAGAIASLGINQPAA